MENITLKFIYVEVGYFLCERERNYNSLLVSACVCCRNSWQVHSLEPWENGDQRRGCEGVFLSDLLVFWILNHVNIQSIFKNTHTNFKNRKMHSQLLPEPSSLPLFCGGRRVWIRIFSFLHKHKHKHNAINTSPLTFPSQFSLPLEKTGIQRNRTTIAWNGLMEY